MVISSSKCLNSDFWQHIADTTDDHIVLLIVQSSSVRDLQFNYRKIQFYGNIYDSLNTVSDEKQFLYLVRLPNFNPEVAPNSQDLPDIVKLNFAVNVITKKLMSHKKSVMVISLYSIN